MPAPNSASSCITRHTEARGFANSTRHGELVVRPQGPTTSPPTGQSQRWHRALRAVHRHGGTVTSSARSVPTNGRLLQLYGVHKTMREAAKKHLRVTRRQRPMAPSNSPSPPETPPDMSSKERIDVWISPEGAITLEPSATPAAPARRPPASSRNPSAPSAASSAPATTTAARKTNNRNPDTQTT